MAALRGAVKRWLQRSALPAVVVIAGLAFLGQFYSWRFDLTDDHRYTLSPFTLRTIGRAHQSVYITCYLGGTLPLEFGRSPRARGLPWKAHRAWRAPLNGAGAVGPGKRGGNLDFSRAVDRLRRESRHAKHP